MNFVYLLRCKDGSLYCGSTKDLVKRVALHNTGKGSSYVRSRGGGKVVYSEQLPTWSMALQREAEIKRLPKYKKEILVSTVIK